MSAKKRLTVKDILSLKSASDVRLSPDGARVAFVVSEADFEESRRWSHLWMTPTTLPLSKGEKEGVEPRQLTRGRETVAQPQWSPDGGLIAFLSDRVEKPLPPEEKPKKQVWLLPVEGGEAFALTVADEGVVQFGWSPDGREIFYVAQEALPPERKTQKEHDKKAKRDGVVEEQEKFRKEIWRIEVESKKATKIFDGDFGLSEVRVSPDGTRLAYTTNYTGKPDDYAKTDIWVLNLSDGQRWKLVERGGGKYRPRWSPSGHFIAFVTTIDPDVPYSQPHVFVARAEGGEMRDALAQFNRGVEGDFHWGADDERLYFIAAQGTVSRLCVVNLKMHDVTGITAADRVYRSFDVSDDETRFVIIAEDADSPTDLWLSDAPGEAKRLTRLNPQLEEFEIAETEVVHWRSRDGLDIEGILTKPLGYEEGKRYPLLVNPHGGPHGRVAQTLTWWQVFAAQGYAVFAPNFRGSSGYGKDFDVGSRHDIGGKDFDDVMTGVDVLIERGIADAERLAIYGGSYGGYLTNWAIARTKRFKAAVSIYGIFNLITDFSNSTIPSWDKNYLGVYYWEDLTPYLERSPFKYASEIETPVLILHGDVDDNTFISNSKEMWQALTHLSRTVEFVHYPREGHGFQEPNHQMDAYARMLRWFDRFLKGDTFASVAGRLGEPVEANGWAMTLTAEWRDVKFPGMTADGQFVQVDLHFKATEPGKPLTLDFPRDAALIAPDGREIPPKGIPFEHGEHRALITGQPSVKLEGEAGATFTLTLTFDVPADAKEFALRVKDFPLVRVRLFSRSLEF
jgi:dipeptidyl aminopeptidase/acylaminoacyl peptidase